MHSGGDHTEIPEKKLMLFLNQCFLSFLFLPIKHK